MRFICLGYLTPHIILQFVVLQLENLIIVRSLRLTQYNSTILITIIQVKSTVKYFLNSNISVINCVHTIMYVECMPFFDSLHTIV